MKNKNNNQNEFERLGGQKSGGGGYILPIPPPLDPPLGTESVIHPKRVINIIMKVKSISR